MTPDAAIELAPGSFVVERYVYSTARGKQCVQWLAEVVGADGELWLMKACRTRSEALDVIDRHGTQAARNAR